MSNFKWNALKVMLQTIAPRTTINPNSEQMTFNKGYNQAIADMLKTMQHLEHDKSRKACRDKT